MKIIYKIYKYTFQILEKCQFIGNSILDVKTIAPFYVQCLHFKVAHIPFFATFI